LTQKAGQADPNTHEVTAADVVATSTEQQLHELAGAAGRRIELVGLSNLRDLGGYPVAGGRRLRWRTLFRSDAPRGLDAAGVAALAGLGLRTVVDLRTQAEVELAPSGLAGLTVRTAHVPIIGGDLESLPLELDAIYRHMVDERGDAIAAAIKVLSGQNDLPALLHCSAGKDRTGVVVAVLLAALGVSDELIAADYALSSRYLDPGQTPVIGRLAEASGLGDELAAELLRSPPGLIAEALSRVRATAGSAEDYLFDHGLRPIDLANLRAALIAPGSRR